MEENTESVGERRKKGEKMEQEKGGYVGWSKETRNGSWSGAGKRNSKEE